MQMQITKVPRKRKLKARDKDAIRLLVVHTTGTGVYRRSKPLQWVLSYYTRQSVTPHFVISEVGNVYQVAEIGEWANHVGYSWLDRRRFANGTWRDKVPKAMVEQWDRRWWPAASPLVLVGAEEKSVNRVSVGVEMIPQPDATFTGRQYAALRELRKQHLDGVSFSELMPVGHEDVNPLRRPGWDPGAFLGRFDWTLAGGAQQ